MNCAEASRKCVEPHALSKVDSNAALPSAVERSPSLTPSASDADPSLHKDEDCPRRKEKGAAFVYGGAGAPAAATVAADNSALRNLFSD